MKESKLIKCPHCLTEIESRAKVCYGCGAEVIFGPRFAELILGGFIGIFISLTIHNPGSDTADLSKVKLPILGYFEGINSFITRNNPTFFWTAFFLGLVITWLIMCRRKRYIRKRNI